MSVTEGFARLAIPIKKGDRGDDFSDLEPLRRVLESRRVVLLGEHSHGDGAAFALKARLAAFLRQELGFDVLAFEAGVYDCAAAWRFIRNTVPEPANALRIVRMAIPAIWSRCAQVQPLLETIISSVGSARPLELIGFDCQLGEMARDRLAQDLKELVLDCGGCTETEWTTLNAAANAIVTEQHPQPLSVLPDEAIRARFIDTLQRAENLILARGRDSNVRLDARIVHSIRLHAENIWAPDQHDKAWRLPYMRRREVAMSSLLRWWIEERYPDRRMIVWAHQGHLLRRLKDVASWTDWHVSDHTAGEAAWLARPREVYTVGFTACSGSFGRVAQANPVPVPRPSDGSIEGAMLSSTYDAAFIDFSSVSESAALRPCTCRLKGHREVRVDPCAHLDGLVLLRESEPAFCIEGR